MGTCRMPASDGDSAGNPASAPDGARRSYEAGNVALRRGNAAQAATAYEQAVDLWPAYADAWLNLGAAFRRLDRIEAAAACARRVLDLRPEDTRAMNNLANVLAALGRFDE